MTDYEYGKRAYILNEELKRRVENIEKTDIINVYKTIMFNCTVSTLNEYKSATFKVNAPRNGVSLFELCFGFENSDVEFIVYINGIRMYSSKIKPFCCFEFGLCAGVNTVKIEFSENVSLDFDAFLKISGYVDYVNENYKLSAITLGDNYYIMLSDGDCVNLYRWSDADKVLVLKIENVIEARVIGCYGSLAYVVYIDNLHQLNFVSYNTETESINYKTILKQSVTSVGGYVTDDGTIFVIAINLNDVFIASGSSGSNLLFEKINLKGNKIYSDAKAVNSFILTDVNNTARLVIIDNEKYYQYNIGAGENFHLYFDGELYKITYTLNGVSKIILFNGNKVVKIESDGYYHEKIVLDDNFYIKRIRDNVIFIKE